MIGIHLKLKILDFKHQKFNNYRCFEFQCDKIYKFISLIVGNSKLKNMLNYNLVKL